MNRLIFLFLPELLIAGVALAAGPAIQGGRLGSANPALAAPANGQPGSEFQWNGPDYAECGPSCLYDKANQNLSALWLYDTNKFESLIAKYDPNKPGNFTDAMDKRLPGFCLKQDTEEDCFTRFKEGMPTLLQHIQSDIHQNADAALQLRSDNPAANPPFVLKPAKDAKGNPILKLAQLPSIPTTDDLMREIHLQNQLQSRLQAQVKNSIKPDSRADLLDELSPESLKPMDFAMTTPVPVDPKNPSAGKTALIRRKADGSAVIDQKKWQKFGKLDSQLTKDQKDRMRQSWKAVNTSSTLMTKGKTVEFNKDDERDYIDAENLMTTTFNKDIPAPAKKAVPLSLASGSRRSSQEHQDASPAPGATMNATVLVDSLNGIPASEKEIPIRPQPPSAENDNSSASVGLADEVVDRYISGLVEGAIGGAAPSVNAAGGSGGASSSAPQNPSPSGNTHQIQ